MARISVEQRALTDSRFDLLGHFLESNRDDALGKMVRVWNECQERNSYTLPERIVGAIFGQRDAADWLVQSDLAVWDDKKTLRIKGTEGRIEWLAVKRSAARKNGTMGGRPKANLNATNEQPTSVRSRLQPETPPAPAPAPKDKEPIPHLTQDLRSKGDCEKNVSEVKHTNHLHKNVSEVSDKPKRGGELHSLASQAGAQDVKKEPSSYAKRLAAALCQEEPPPDEPELEPWEIEPPQEPERAPPLDEDTPEGLWAYIHAELSQVSEKRVRKLIAQGLSRHEAYRAAATWRKKEGNGIENIGAYQYQLLESEFKAARATQ